MRRLSLDHFDGVMTPLLGKRIGLVRPDGNVGDRLIEWGTLQLLAEYGVRWQWYRPGAAAEVDEIVFGGGGNMGEMYPTNHELRRRCLRAGPPVVILPQSFTSREDRPFHRVYVRERASLALCPGGLLAPDLALALDYPCRTRPSAGVGVYLRRDRESAVRRGWFIPDPARRCRQPRDYLELAARHERIITDRLHFAIAGLIVGRPTILLPNSYHKNASMHETWLRDLGCGYAGSVAEALPGPPRASA